MLLKPAAKAKANRKLTVAEATSKILTDLGVGADGSDDDDDDDDDGNDDDSEVVKKKKQAKSKAKAKAKSKAKAKKAPAAKAKVIKKKVAATIGNETSRKQVRCRAADGSSFSISYKKAGGEAKALAKAKKWLSEQ